MEGQQARLIDRVLPAPLGVQSKVERMPVTDATGSIPSDPPGLKLDQRRMVFGSGEERSF